MAEPERRYSPKGQDEGAGRELSFQENLGFFLKAVYRYKYLILLFTALVTAGVYYHHSRQPKIYQTSAKMFIGRDSGGGPGVTPFAEQRQDMGFGDMATHQTMMRTRLVGQETLAYLAAQGIDPFPGAGDPAGAVVNSTKVSIEKGSKVIAVLVDHTDPMIAMHLANAIATVYSKLLVQKGSTEIGQSVALLRNEMMSLKKRVEGDQNKVKAFELENPRIRDITMLEEQVKQMRSDLVTLKSTKDELASHMEQVKELVQTVEEEEWTERMVSLPVVAGDAAVKAIMDKIYQKELDLTKARKKFQEKYPEVQMQLAEINALRKLLEKRVDKVVDELRSRFMSVVARLEQLDREAKEGEDTLSGIFQKKTEYDDLKSEVEISQQLYDVLAERIKQADILGRVRQTPAMIVSEAQVPHSPYKPKTERNTMLAFVVALFGSMYLSYVYYMNRHTVQREDDIMEYLKLKFLGQIPAIKEGAEDSFLVDREGWEKDAIHLLSQSVLLELAQANGNKKVFLMTSTMPKEGKSYVSCNLAAHLAAQGKKIVVVGADFRGPQIARVFGVQIGRKTLDRYLQGREETLEGIIHPTKVENLSIVENGSPMRNPLELLDSGKFEAAINELAEKFEYVLLDTPPLGLFYDAEIIARRFPNVVMVVREDHVPCNTINRVVQRMDRRGANIMGGLINFRSLSLSMYPMGTYSRYAYSGRYRALSPVQRETRRIRRHIINRLQGIFRWCFTFTGLFPKRGLFRPSPLPGEPEAQDQGDRDSEEIS